ncbi:MAG: RNA 2',3'-cyclic phosphodiesterase [Thermotogota bacterium]
MRCFISLEVGEAVKRQSQSLISLLKQMGFEAKWVEDENFHITLFFLGVILSDQLEKTAEMLKNFRIEPFRLSINKLGYFQKHAKPTVIWLGLTKSEPLFQLYSTMREQLEVIYPQPFSKKFNPHLTLGRIKRAPEDWKGIIKTTKVEIVEIGDIVLSLKSSILTETGPIYKTLEKTVR